MTGGETLFCTTDEILMLSGFDLFDDAEATLVFFFWAPWSSLDFLFLLLMSAILRVLCNKYRISRIIVEGGGEQV